MQKYSDEEQLSEQLHDKSTQLWTQAAKKRHKMIQSLAPGYSRHRKIQEQSTLIGVMDKQVEGLKEKLKNQRSSSKHKDVEIQQLKQEIGQLNKEKKILLSQIDYVKSQPHDADYEQNTMNFEKTNNHGVLKDQKSKKQKKHIFTSKQSYEERLQDLSRQKLSQLLRSTSQYRSFANYYDSQKLVFLKDYHQNSRKILKDPIQKKDQWTQEEILIEFSRANQKQNLGLNYQSQTLILSKMRDHYDRLYEKKSKQIKNQYEAKLKKAHKQSNIIPQDLQNICKMKESQLAQQITRKTMKSLKK